MRIESITLHNFRQFRGDVTINFEKALGKDLHIILAKNGVGKTNILNAITWCLYYKESHLADPSISICPLNANIINEAHSINKKIDTVSVKLVLELDDNRQAHFTREDVYNISTHSPIRENSSFKIMAQNEDGAWMSYDGENAKEAMHEFIPDAISDFIFFDGEQLDKFFDEAHDQKVKNGIIQFTQSLYLTEAKKAIDTYVRDNLASKFANSGDNEISKIQNEIKGLETTLGQVNDEINTYFGQIEKAQNEIMKCDEIIGGKEESQKWLEKEKNAEAAIKQADDLIAQKCEEICKVTRKDYEDIAIAPSIKSYYNFLQQLTKDKRIPPSVDKSVLEGILNDYHCPICNNNSPDINYVKEILAKIDIRSTTSALLNQGLGALSDYSNRMAEYLPHINKLFSELKVLRDNRKQSEEEYTIAHNKLKGYANVDEIGKAIGEKEGLVNAVNKLYEDIGARKQNKEQIEQRVKGLEDQKTELIKKQKHLALIQKHIQFWQECSSLAAEISKELVQECKEELEFETFNIFQSLISKDKGLFTKVIIDDNYKCKLLNQYGGNVRGNLSAAERSLLAMAFTIALQKVSQHDSLLFIDTPLGRVDDDNRSLYVDRMIQISKQKQVILTFTTTEYDSDVRTILDGNIGTLVHLNISNEGETSIKA